MLVPLRRCLVREASYAMLFIPSESRCRFILSKPGHRRGENEEDETALIHIYGVVTRPFYYYRACRSIDPSRTVNYYDQNFPDETALTPYLGVPHPTFWGHFIDRTQTASRDHADFKPRPLTAKHHLPPMRRDPFKSRFSDIPALLTSKSYSSSDFALGSMIATTPIGRMWYRRFTWKLGLWT